MDDGETDDMELDSKYLHRWPSIFRIQMIGSPRQWRSLTLKKRQNLRSPKRELQTAPTPETLSDSAEPENTFNSVPCPTTKHRCVPTTNHVEFGRISTQRMG
jgi:hypothetical protein